MSQIGLLELQGFILQPNICLIDTWAHMHVNTLDVIALFNILPCLLNTERFLKAENDFEILTATSYPKTSLYCLSVVMCKYVFCKLDRNDKLSLL